MNHYGIYVNENQPITGVTSGNIPTWLWDENYIDLDYESHVMGCENCQNGEACEIADMWEYSETLLFGNWKLVNELYEPDTSGEYAAIYNNNENTIQIVFSKTIKSGCGLCSPCFPGQADLDSVGEYKAYDLPAELYETEG